MGAPKQTDEVRIRNVPRNQKKALNNISKRTDITISALMRPKVTELINSYPAHYREEMIDLDD